MHQKVVTTERLAYFNGEDVDYLDPGAECVVECEDNEPDTFILLHWPYGEDGGVCYEIGLVSPKQWKEVDR